MNKELKKKVEKIIGPFSITGVSHKPGQPCVISDKNKNSVRLKFVKREWTEAEEDAMLGIPEIITTGSSQIDNSYGFQGATIHFNIEAYYKDSKKTQKKEKNLSMVGKFDVFKENPKLKFIRWEWEDKSSIKGVVDGDEITILYLLGKYYLSVCVAQNSHRSDIVHSASYYLGHRKTKWLHAGELTELILKWEEGDNVSKFLEEDKF